MAPIIQAATVITSIPTIIFLFFLKNSIIPPGIALNHNNILSEKYTQCKQIKEFVGYFKKPNDRIKRNKAAARGF